MPTRIGDRTVPAPRPRPVTPSEVAELLATAQAGGRLTTEQRAQVTALLQAPSDQFDPGVRDQLSQLLSGGAPPRRAVADPAVLARDATSIAWTPVGPDGRLYVDDVRFDDVIQGSVANCYMVSAFSAIAQADPQVIRDAITDNGDGTYTVRFYEASSGAQAPTCVSITVDSDLPTSTLGDPARYAHARDVNELWVPVLEKAFAQWKGGYDVLGAGGRPGDVFQALTGKAFGWTSSSSTTPDQLFKQVQDTTAAHRPMTASTYGKNTEVDYTGTSIFPWHSYTVVGASTEGGQRYIELRNPWGKVEPGNDGADDGLFKLKLEDFTRLYQGIYSGG